MGIILSIIVAVSVGFFLQSLDKLSPISKEVIKTEEDFYSFKVPKNATLVFIDSSGNQIERTYGHEVRK